MPNALSLLILACPAAQGEPASELQTTFIPGLVRIPEGKVLVGRDRKDVERLVAQSPNSADELGAMVPKTEMFVPEFFIGPTEVTNEMYLRFVQAAGYMPPPGWAVISRELREALIVAGKKNDPAYKLDDEHLSRWWEENWQAGKWAVDLPRPSGNPDEIEHLEFELRWEVPPHRLLEPVSSVSQADAEAYCRWAGLRLPTEFEWVRAARGDDYRSWPFGDEFDPKIVACQTTEPRHLANKVLPVNSFAANASPFGCVDMAGNLYEWTRSAFRPLPRFEPFQVEIPPNQKVGVRPVFDASKPVIKGGSFVQRGWTTQIDPRVGILDFWRSPYVGFRAASSALPTRNYAEYAAREVEFKVLGAVASEELDFDSALGLERRRYADLEALAAQRRPSPPEDRLPEAAPPATYAVFDGYDCVTAVPLRALNYNSTEKLARAARDEGPVPVGILAATVPLAAPNVQPGTYVLAYLPELGAEEILALGATLPPELQEKTQAAAAKAAAKEQAKDKGRKGTTAGKGSKEGGQEAEAPASAGNLPAAEAPQARNGAGAPQEPAAAGAAPEGAAAEEGTALRVVRPRPDCSGLLLEPRKSYFLVLDQLNRALGAIPLKDEPRLMTTRAAPRGIALNLGTDRVEFQLRASGERGRAFSFRFAIQPVGPEGSLVRPGYWDGKNYAVIEPAPSPLQ